MFSHISLGISDYPTAFAFYSGLAEVLGLSLGFEDAAKGFAAWQPADAQRPLLLISRPFNGEPAAPGNGTMVALNAASRALVHRAHDYALAHGGTDEGAPGLRPHYHPHYYGAYFRDPDGNKLCVVCHASA